MNIALPRNLEENVAQLVQTAGYQGSDEVVSEALREHQARRQMLMRADLRGDRFAVEGEVDGSSSGHFLKPV